MVMHGDAGSARHDRLIPRGPWGRSVLRAVLVSSAVLVAYFVLPFTGSWTSSVLAFLTGGLALTVTLLVWEIRAIRHSRYPRLKAFEVLIVTVPLFMVVFAATYFLMAQADPDGWSEPLTRLDCLYFALTTFATVGFGDVHAVSQPARAVVTAQMAGNLILIGFVVRIVMRAVEDGVALQSTTSARNDR